MAVMSQTIGKELAEALGLGERITSIDLHFRSGDIVRATVEYAPSRDQLGKVVSILKRYELHEKSVEVTPVVPEETTEVRR